MKKKNSADVIGMDCESTKIVEDPHLSPASDYRIEQPISEKLKISFSKEQLG